MAHHKPHGTSTSALPPMGDDGGLSMLQVEHQGQGHQEEEEEEDGNNTSSSPSSSSMGCLLPARSLRSTATDEASHSEQADCGGIRSLSFSKIFSFRKWAPAGSTSTLEDYIVDQLEHQLEYDGAANKDKNKEEEEEEEEKLRQVCRSQSVPATSVARRFSGTATQGKKGSRRVADSSSVRRLTMRVVPLRRVPPLPSPDQAIARAEEEEDIAAEEAVCRICMVALSEESVLKLECWCKGELALAHRACAIKWFSIKGNGTCDVCSQEVLNLPVTLRRLPGLVSQAGGGGGAAATTTTSSSSSSRVWVWHGTPILVIVSMLAYFCFLEQLLVGDHGTAALAISLPFACVLGLFSSLTTTKMVSRRYVWIYSAVQFLFIVLFTHIFYRYVRMQAVIAIILSTFAGFSVAICTNSLLQILRWKASRHAVASPTTAADTQGHGFSSRDRGASVALAEPDLDLEIALPPAPA